MFLTRQCASTPSGHTRVWSPWKVRQLRRTAGGISHTGRPCPCPISTPYNLTAPAGTLKLWWVLNRWNEYGEKSTANQSEPGAVMLTRSQSYASGSSGRDRGSRRGSVTKPRAGNAVGRKLHPGRMIFLISSVGPSPLTRLLPCLNAPDRSGATGAGSGPPLYLIGTPWGPLLQSEGDR